MRLHLVHCQKVKQICACPNCANALQSRAIAFCQLARIIDSAFFQLAPLQSQYRLSNQSKKTTYNRKQHNCLSVETTESVDPEQTQAEQSVVEPDENPKPSTRK